MARAIDVLAARLEAISHRPKPEHNQLLDEFVEQDPGGVRYLVESHPKHLFRLLGWSVEPFHERALDLALAWRELLWLAPRGSGKSTTYVFLAAWLAIARPEVYEREGVPRLFPDAPHQIDPTNIRIALTSNSAEKAVGLVWQAKAILTHRRVQRLFGNLVGPRWKDYMSSTSLRTGELREGTFNALGLGTKLTGYHYDVVIPDDWVTEDNARTELQRQRLVDFWGYTVAPTREPWARVFGAGTRYHPQDWYQTVKAWEDAKLWGKVHVDAALVEVGPDLRSYWPEFYPVRKLLEIREQIGELAFATQYQNRVDALLGDFFERHWVERFQAFEELPQADRARAIHVIALDPSIKAGPRNDYSVFCVLAYVSPYFYVRRIVRGQWTQFELCQLSEQLWKEYRPRVLAVEAVQGQEWLIQELRRTTKINVREMRPQQWRGKDKVGRASEIRKHFEQERVFFQPPAADNQIQRLVYEMLCFPARENTPGCDDCVDALVWAMLAASQPTAKLHRLQTRRGF